jgi:hypothetical protein
MIGAGLLASRVRRGFRVHRVVNRRIKKLDQFLGSLVLTLRKARNKADYVLDKKVSRNDAQNMMRVAHLAWQRLGQIP